jgi:hypothetical protein
MPAATASVSSPYSRIALLASVALSAFLIVALVDDPAVFYSGDGGMKALMTRQHVRDGLHADLRLPAQPWVEGLWRQGLYPFGPPFVYRISDRHYVHFAPLFAAITSPIYRVFGDWGFYLLPFLGACATWLALFMLGNRLQLGDRATALAIVICAFASPLPLYGAMFWEHAPAVGLVTLALATLCRGGPVAAVTAGLLMAAAGALRPEALVVSGLLGAVFLFFPIDEIPRRRAAASLAALSFGVAILFLVNQLLFGRPLGLQSLQVGATILPAHELLFSFLKETVRFFPAALFCPFLLFGRQASSKRLIAAIGAFVLFAALLLPSDGGKRWGPRYLLVIFPLLAISAAGLITLCSSGRWRRALPLLGLLIAYGAYWNLGEGGRLLREDYRTRLPPLIHFFEEKPDAIVAVTHQWIAQELWMLVPRLPFFRLQGLDRSQIQLDEQDLVIEPLASARVLASGLHRAARSRYWLIAYDFQKIPDTVEADGLVTRYTRHEQLGTFSIYQATVSAP